MTQFVRGANPIWFYNNLVGQVVDDTYYAFFLENISPYNTQNVYQDPNGLVVWSNPIEFQASGGLPNNIYFDETLTYRIEIRQGPTRSDPLVYLIENFNIGGQFEEVLDEVLTAENMITNPQFADVYFNGSVTYSASGTYDIAPGWQLSLSGTGTFTVTQGTNNGASHLKGNPSYYLNFTATGSWTQVQLIQTFTNNGSIFSPGAIVLAFTLAPSGASQNVTVSYVPNGAANSQEFFNALIPAGGFLPYYGALSPINDSLNLNTNGDANVSIVITLPTNCNISISNVQLLGQSDALSAGFLLPSADGADQNDVPTYKELTYERMVDHEFNIYRDSIIMQPKDTILTGWNFPLNPWQFTTKTLTNVSANQYTADQTIIIQQNYVAANVNNNVSVGQDVNTGGFKVQAVTAHNQFAIIQFIDSSSVYPYWNSILSSLVKCLISSPSHSSQIRFKMRLIVNTSTPTTIGRTYPISSWTEGSDPAFDLAFTVLTPLNDPIYTFGSSVESFSFENFILPSVTTASYTLGIVLYTIDNMNQAATADYIVFNDVSLVPNRFAIASNAKTFDQVLKECQFYYCKTFPQGTVPDESTPSGYPGALGYQAFEAGLNPGGYYWQFPSIMRSQTPTMHYYSPILVTNNAWYNKTNPGASGVATTDVISDRAVFVGNPQIAVTDRIGDFIAIHATADAKIGL